MWEFRHNLIIEKFADYEDLTLSGITFIKEKIGALEIRFENFNEIKSPFPLFHVIIPMGRRGFFVELCNERRTLPAGWPGGVLNLSGIDLAFVL